MSITQRFRILDLADGKFTSTGKKATCPCGKEDLCDFQAEKIPVQMLDNDIAFIGVPDLPVMLRACSMCSCRKLHQFLMYWSEDHGVIFRFMKTVNESETMK